MIYKVLGGLAVTSIGLAYMAGLVAIQYPLFQLERGPTERIEVVRKYNPGISGDEHPKNAESMIKLSQCIDNCVFDVIVHAKEVMNKNNLSGYQKYSFDQLDALDRMEGCLKGCDNHLSSTKGETQVEFKTDYQIKWN